MDKNYWKSFVLLISLISCKSKAAYNKRFYAIAAGRWSNRQQIFIQLLFGLDVQYSAKQFIFGIETTMSFSFGQMEHRKPQLHKAMFVACNPSGQLQMTENKRHPVIIYFVQICFIGLIYWFYKEQLNNKQADTFDNFVYRTFATCLILVSFTIVIWTVFKWKKYKFWLGSALLFVLTIATFRACYKAVYSLPFSQRFLIQNKSGLTLTNVRLIGDTIISVKDIKPNETVKAEYKNYLENTSIDLAVQSLGYKDTVNLVSGLTNSIGYLSDVKIKFENNRYKVEVTN